MCIRDSPVTVNLDKMGPHLFLAIFLGMGSSNCDAAGVASRALLQGYYKTGYGLDPLVLHVEGDEVTLQPLRWLESENDKKSTLTLEKGPAIMTVKITWSGNGIIGNPGDEIKMTGYLGEDRKAITVAVDKPTMLKYIVWVFYWIPPQLSLIHI